MQGIYRQIFNRRSISRKITHPQLRDLSQSFLYLLGVSRKSDWQTKQD